MCGIFGFIMAGEGKGPTINSLKAMAVAAESRGRHAFGISWIDAEGRIHCYKQAGRISQHLDVLNLCNGAKAVIGHTRWATHGSIDDNTNNHPHPVDGGWLVHNGIVSNYAELIRDHRLLPQSRCDSEVLGLLIERFKGSFLKRVCRTIEAVASDAPLSMAALWTRPGRVIVVRRGNPVFVGEGRTGNVYFCSCADGLPGVVKPMDDNTVFQYDIQSGDCQSRPVAERRVVKGKVYEGSTTFTAGAGSGSNTRMLWRDDLDACSGFCDEPTTDLDDDEVEDEAQPEDTQTAPLFDDETPDSNDPAKIQAAIERTEAKIQKAREALTATQRKALDLLDKRAHSGKSRVDAVKRYNELKTKGTIGGKPAKTLKGGIE
jgi:hypothetical protein